MVRGMKGSSPRLPDASSSDDKLRELGGELEGFKRAAAASFSVFSEDLNCLRLELLSLQSAVQLYHHSLLREPPWPPEVIADERHQRARRLHKQKIANVRKARRARKRSKWQEVRGELLSVTGVSDGIHKGNLGKVESEIVEQIDSVLDELMIQESSDSAQESTDDEGTSRSSYSQEESGAESAASRGCSRPRRRPLSIIPVPSVYTDPSVYFGFPGDQNCVNIETFSDLEELALRERLLPKDRNIQGARSILSAEEDAIRSLSSRVLNQIKDNVRQSSSGSARLLPSRTLPSSARGRGKVFKAETTGAADVDASMPCGDIEPGKARGKRKPAREDVGSVPGQRLLGATKRRLQNAELARLSSRSSEDERSPRHLSADGRYSFSSDIPTARLKK